MSSNSLICQVVDLPPFGEILDSFKEMRRHSPVTISFRVEGTFFGRDSVDHQAVKFVPTCIRVAFDPQYEVPQYEVEGWIFQAEPERVWARLVLLCGDEADYLEGDIRRLAPCEELGMAPSDWSRPSRPVDD